MLKRFGDCTTDAELLKHWTKEDFYGELSLGLAGARFTSQTNGVRVLRVTVR